MDNTGENVIFDNQQSNNGQNDPNADPNAQPPPDQGGMGGEVPPGGDQPSDGTDYAQDGTIGEDSGPPPPSGVKGFLFGGGKRKKILIGVVVFIFLIIIIVLIIPKNQAPKEVTLTWWGVWEDAATMQPLIDDFERQNPNIKIQYTKQDHDRYRDTLLTRINNGTGPDIFRFHNSWVPTLSKIVAPLPSSVISVNEFNQNYYPVIQKDLIQNGAIYAIPLGIDSIALFVNTDLLNAAGLSVPKDWNQFVSAAKKLTVREPETNDIKIAGAALGTYGNVNHAPDIISVMFLQQGIDPKKFSEATENLNAALAFYTAFSKGQDAVWDSSLGNSQLEFARGNAAMYFGYSWDIFALDQYKTEKKLNYTIHPVPSLLEGSGITAVSYWVEGVSARSKNQKEAMIFMKYLAQKETVQKFYSEAAKTRAFGEPYPRIDLADELKDDDVVYPFVSQLSNAGSTFFASNTHDGETGLNSRANTYLENAINGIVNDNNAVQEEVETLQEGIAKILQENGIK
jgi:multiple sugar transport system substrate-binding protein